MPERDVAIVRGRGQITIPTALRRAAGLEEGDPVEMIRTEEGILLRPKKLIDAEQAWFWSAEWQAGEREASADLEADRGTTYRSDESFLASLTAKPKAKAPRKTKRRPKR